MPNGFGIPRNFRPRSWPRLREYNTLLKVATPIPEDVLAGDRWLAGIAYDPLTLAGMSCWSPSCDTEDDWDSSDIDDDLFDPVDFVPVELRTFVKCSTLGLDIDELKARTQANVDALQSATLTRLLIGHGDTDSCWENPTISGSGESLAVRVGSEVYALDAAVARMEDQLASVLGDALGTIFMTPGQLGLLQNRGGLIFEDGCWWTPTGTAIVADGGVSGNGPDVGDDEPGAGNQIEWIYGTGPVYVHRGPATWTPEVFAATDAEDSAILPHNDVTVRVRQMAIALFDPEFRYSIAAGYASSVFVS